MVSTPLQTAIQAAREAGELLVDYFGKIEPSWVEEKSKNDVVSKADREAEAICRRILLGRFPEDRFLGEETGLSGVDESSPVWIVDPLDGTANFVRGFPHWCISIARTSHGLSGPLSLAVIWDPLKKDLFRAEAGAGAFRNDRAMRMPSREGLEGAAVATGFPFRQQAKIDLYLKIFREVFLGVRSIRRAGSAALDLAYTAAGIFDGFFEFGLSPWDTAAGALLIREAGGLVTDFEGGETWRTRGNLLAGSPGVHDALLDLMRANGIQEQLL
ncbi:MAG: inositol monophosphatase family protein [Thermoanaerobaculia bacterium]